MIHSVGGVKVSIVAFQAIDPGSIPGWRIFLFNNLLVEQKITFAPWKHAMLLQG